MEVNSLKIAIDTKDAITASKNLNQLDTSIKKVDNTAKGASNTFNTSLTSLVGMATKVAGVSAALYALQKALTVTVSSGFAFNKQMEESKAGLIALSVAVQDKAIPVTERFARANKEATKTLSELQKINAQTPHTLDQTNKIYKAMYVSMTNVGATTEQMIELTRSLSIASGAAGIEFNSLLAGVDGLASGTVLANSDLGRFLSSLGLTNEKLKESKDVVGLVTEKLKDFKAAGTMAEAVSNLENAWSQLAGTLTEDIFESAKDSAISFAGVLNNLNDRLEDYKANINDISDIHKITNTKVLMRELEQLGQEYVKLIDNGVGWLDSQQSYSAEVKKYEFLIGSAIQKLNRLNESESKSIEVKKGVVELTKEQIKAHKEFLDAWDESEYEDRQAELYPKEKSELEIQNAVDTANAIIAAMESIKTPTEKLTEDNLAVYELMKNIWSTEYMETFFKKWNKEQEDINKKTKGYEGIGSKDWTTGLKGQAKDIANIGNAFADLGKEQKEWNKYSEENVVTEEDKDKHLQAQLSSYGNIAGAMGNMFEEGSKGAKLAQQAQAALAVVEGGLAIVHAMTAGDPYTAVARAMAVAAVVQQAIGSGGGVSAPSAEYAQAVSDANYKAEESNALLEELERHTELLETIANTEGTVAKYQTQSAGLGLTVDLEELYASIIEQSEEMYVALNKHARAFEITGDRVEDIPNILEWFEGGSIDEAGWNWLKTSRSDVLEWNSDFKEAVHDYGMGLADVSESVSDASQSFKDIYDELSGLGTYAKRDLKEAFALMQESFGNTNQSSLLNYLSETINTIETMGAEYAAKARGILLTGTEQEKIIALDDLSKQFNVTFDNGVESALNYLDSIELVAEAMINSRDNIQSFAESFMDSEQIVNTMAQSLGVTVATNMSELINLTRNLAGGIDGLTDAELELLEANKSLIEDGFEVLEDKVSSLESIIDSITSAIERLRGGALGSTYTLDQYYKSMAKTQELSKSGDLEAFSESLQDTISKSNILASAFSSTKESTFAQLVAANQLDEMGVEAQLEQIDYLKMIEENTSVNNALMLDLLRSLGAKIDKALEEKVTTESWVTNGGVSTWTSTGGATATHIPGVSTTITSSTGTQIAAQDAQAWVSEQINAGNYNSIIDTANSFGMSASSVAELMGVSKQDVLDYASLVGAKSAFAFADGGIVTSPTLGLIGEAGYNEAVIPLKDPNDPLNQKALIEEIRMLRSEVSNLRTDNNYYSERIDNNTKPDYFAVS